MCNKKVEWERHINTKKHKINEKREIVNDDIIQTFKCDCGKTYKERSGLWRHAKKCHGLLPVITPDSNLEKNDNQIHLLIQENTDFKNIILDVMKNNADLQKQMLDICKNGPTVNNNTLNRNKIMKKIIKNVLIDKV